MPVNITKQPQDDSSPLSAILRGVLGFAGGGPAGAALGVLSSAKGGIGAGAQLVQAGKGVYDKAAGLGSIVAPSDDKNPMVDQMTGGDNLAAMERRTDGVSPSQSLDNGIAALSHPDIGQYMSPQDIQHVAAILHGAKIFGGDHPAISQYASGIGDA